jgi:hypothetical protein
MRSARLASMSAMTDDELERALMERIAELGLVVDGARSFGLSTGEACAACGLRRLSGGRAEGLSTLPPRQLTNPARFKRLPTGSSRRRRAAPDQSQGDDDDMPLEDCAPGLLPHCAGATWPIRKTGSELRSKNPHKH